MSPTLRSCSAALSTKEALANLIYGVQSRKGFIVLTGEVGTAKPPCWNACATSSTRNRSRSPPLFNSRLTVEQFFELWPTT